VLRGFSATAELLVSLIFLFGPCGGLSWLHVSVLLRALNTHYRIVLDKTLSYSPYSHILEMLVPTASQRPTHGINNRPAGERRHATPLHAGWTDRLAETPAKTETVA